MDVIVICNGLGNQMSQYAFYLMKKKINKDTYYIYDKRSSNTHNGYELKRLFNIDENNRYNYFLYFIFRILSIEKYAFISKKIRYILNKFNLRIIDENPNYDFNINYLQCATGIRFFYGGWHSEKYFSPIKELLLNKYSFKIENNDNYTNNLIKKISNTNSVSVHIRRGDYLSNKNLSTFGSVCSVEYFKKAISKIETLVNDPHYFIFSNDFEWVKENLNLTNCTFIDKNTGTESWKDMYLMSNCKHNIISNSTFSWWGAWLNTNQDRIVISPYYFINNIETKDIYPSEWIRISDY